MVRTLTRRPILTLRQAGQVLPKRQSGARRSPPRMRWQRSVPHGNAHAVGARLGNTDRRVVRRISICGIGIVLRWTQDLYLVLQIPDVRAQLELSVGSLVAQVHVGTRIGLLLILSGQQSIGGSPKSGRNEKWRGTRNRVASTVVALTVTAADLALNSGD